MRRMYSQKQLEKVVDNVIDEKDIAPVSGTSDGTNWTSLTVGDETHGFAAGGGAEKIVYVDSSTTVEELAAIITANKIPVYVYTTSNSKLFLPCVSAANSIYKFAAIDNENLWYVYYNQSWSSMSHYPLSNWAELGWVTLSSTSAQVWDCVQNYTLPILHANNNRDLYFYTYRSDASASGSFVFTRIKDNVCETYTLLNDVWTYSSYSVSGTNDGTNWTSITIGSDTYGIPSGGSGSGFTYREIVVSNWTNSRDITSQFTQSELADMYLNPEKYIVRVRKDNTDVAHYAYLTYNNHVGALTPATQKYTWWDTDYELATQASPPKLWNHGKFEIGYKSEEGVFSYYAYFYARVEYTLS